LNKWQSSCGYGTLEKQKGTYGFAKNYIVHSTYVRVAPNDIIYRSRVRGVKTMNIQSLPLDADDELLQLVARIRARKPSYPLPVPDPAVLASVIARLRDEKPFTPEELEECERELQAVENELRAAEWNDMYKERWI